MTRIRFLALGFISAIALVAFGVAVGQAPLPSLGKTQVQISQEIPIVANLLVPIEGGESITASVPLTMSIDMVVTLSGATVVKVEPAAAPAPTIKVSDAKSVPGMTGLDSMGIPYVLKAPEGLQLDEWTVKLKDDGGIDYKFKVSTPGKKFDSDMQVDVSYLDDSGTEIAKSGVIIFGSKSGQDRETRSYSNSFDCSWSECAEVPVNAKSYTIAFDVEVVDFP